jgi:hypothetical protein
MLFDFESCTTAVLTLADLCQQCRDIQLIALNHISDFIAQQATKDKCTETLMSVKFDDASFDEDIKNLIGQVEQGLLLVKKEESHLPMEITISDDEEVKVETKNFATSHVSQIKGRRQLDFCKEGKRN